MQIECKLKRKGGSIITLSTPSGRLAYHFKPVNVLPGAAHVAEVADEDHIATLLGIREAYRLYHPGKQNPGDMPIADKVPATPMDVPGHAESMPPAIKRQTQAPAATKLREDVNANSAPPTEVDDQGFSPATILQGRIADIVPKLGPLTATQLKELEGIEGKADNRAGLLKAIDRELASRGHRD